MNGKKLRVALMLGVLLVLVVGGEAGARPKTAAQQTHVVIISGTDFSPGDKDTADIAGWETVPYLEGGGIFVAPVVFPGTGDVRVKRMVVYAYDNHASYNNVTQLKKKNAAAGTDVIMAEVTTSGQSAVTPRAFADNSAVFSLVKRDTHVPWIGWSNLGTENRLYAVKIFYVNVP